MTGEGTLEQVLAGEARWCVICADCLDVLPTLGDGCVDAVVTDPPYGIGFDYGGAHDDEPDTYPHLIAWLVQQCCRLSQVSAVWQSGKNISRFSEWFPGGFRVGASCKNFVQIRPNDVAHAWDPVVWWGRSRHIKGTPHWRDWHVADVASALGMGKLEHPCPRQIDAAEHFVGMLTAEGDTILDPFAGSGTTGVAALRLGRRVILIEREQRWADLCRERLLAEEQGSTLRARKAGQVALFGGDK